MYLDARVLAWSCDLQSWSEIDNTEKSPAESLLDRAERHLYADKSKDARADCVVTLRRALNQRLKIIEKIHEFKKIDIPSRLRGYFELLEIFGIVRPLLLKKLIKIRNGIEHEDSDPPSQNQCKEYVDVVWYFLKSTNRIVSMKSDDFIFNKLGSKRSETQYWITLRTKDKTFNKIHVTGWVPKSYIRKSTKSKDYIPLDVSEIGTKDGRWPNSESHADKLPTDTWINGYISLSSSQRQSLVSQVVNL